LRIDFKEEVSRVKLGIFFPLQFLCKVCDIIATIALLLSLDYAMLCGDELGNAE
jgi:hypothetical protein